MKLIYSAFFLAAWMHSGCSVYSEPPHPILPISGSGAGADAILSTWPETEYTNRFIPRYGPRNDQPSQVPPVVPGDTAWTWSISNPDRITSMPSGTVFPNENYPVQTQSVTVMSGKTVEARFYLAAGSTTQKSLVFNLISHYQRIQLRRHLQTLSQAYINSGDGPVTRNDAYARRIAVSLLAWARCFPDYTLTAKNKAEFVDAGPSYILPSDMQRASSHNGFAHEWAYPELEAFDAIYDSVALVALSTEMGFDVRDYIKTNYFFFGGDFFVDRVPVSLAIKGNLSFPFSVLAKVARVLNRPDYTEWLDAYINATMEQKINRDGVLPEGLGYSIMYVNENIQCVQNISDYFLTRPTDTPELESVRNRVTNHLTTLIRGRQKLSDIALPNGQLPSFGDTSFNVHFIPRDEGKSALLPAYGTVSLGAGRGDGAVQLNQNFSGKNIHMRSDITAFTLWAFGHEYLGNIRYHNSTAGRTFGNQILAHNAVTIDRTNPVFPSGNTIGNGDLTLYERGLNGLAVTEIDGQRSYANKASRYQRFMLLNTQDLAMPYAVDIFRVAGGQTHDYTFHGSVRYDSTWECSFLLEENLADYPMLESGETWFEPQTAYSAFPYYGVWRNVSSNRAPGNFEITYRDPSDLRRDVRLWMTDDGTAEVHIGSTPVPARDNSQPATFWVNNLWRPSSIIRRRSVSGEPLESLFVSVIEPMSNGVSVIQSVERLPMAGSSLESCAIRITLTDGREDTYVVNLNNPSVNGSGAASASVFTADGRYVLNGRIGAVSDGPSGERVWTVGANHFEYDGRRFSPPRATFSGEINGVTRKQNGAGQDAFTTASPLPNGILLQGRKLSLNFGALSGEGAETISEMFEIDQVIFDNDRYHICLTADHQLERSEDASMIEQVAPRRTFTGESSFEIVNGASDSGWVAKPEIRFTADFENTNHFRNFSYATASAWVSAGSRAVYIHEGGGAGRARFESEEIFDFSAYANGSVAMEFISTVTDLSTRFEVGLLDAAQVSNYDQPFGRRDIFGFSVCHTDSWNLPGLLYNGASGAPYPSATNVIDGIEMTARSGTHLYKIVFMPFRTELYRNGLFLGATTHVLDFSRNYKIAMYAQGNYPGTSVDRVRLSARAAGWPGAIRMDLKSLFGGQAVIIRNADFLHGTAYRLLSSTSLHEPVNQWTSLATGALSDGSLNITNHVDYLDKQRFYRLKMY